MGCCSSRETSDGPSSNSEVVRSPVARDVPQTTNAPSHTPLTQSAPSYPPALASTSSRLPLTTPSLHTPGSNFSSPRPSNVDQRSSQGPSRGQSIDPLASHYNVPLVPPKPWRSNSRTWTLPQLRKERQDFFDTRVTGQREIWEALRQVAECVGDGDINTAQGILDAVNCTLPTGRLEEGCYDERGNLYKLPPNVLTSPLNIVADEPEEVDGETVIGVPSTTKGEVEIEKPTETDGITVPISDATTINKGKAVEEVDAVKLKCRLSTTGSDVIVLLGRSQTAGKLTERLREEAAVTSDTRIRIFYLGRELKDKKTLDDQGYKEGHVLNIFVADTPA